MSRKQILSRYARTEDGKVIIEVGTTKIQDLYHDFDKTAPYLRKDLDEQLVDYLSDAAREIGGDDFVIQITLAESPQDAPMSRVKKSIQNYFVYLAELERRTMRRMARTSLILLGVGLSILVISVFVNRMTASAESVVAEVFAEGLTVAAWVSLWEALATFLIRWTPHRRERRIHQRLSEAPVLFDSPE
jgi:hypothetical protein